MLVVYDTRSGKVKKFVEKSKLRAVQITPDLRINEPFVMVTYTDGKGEVPQSTTHFLLGNGRYLRGVAASGNKVFDYFAVSADIISQQFEVPIIHKFEFAGGQKDVNTFKEWVQNYAAYSVK